MKQIIKENCGCEFITLGDEDGQCTYLHKCRCQKHYDEQFIAKWIDENGEHCENYTPENHLPLETK